MKRSAIVLHAQDVFQEPLDATDANRRLDLLRMEILQIEDVLKTYGTSAPPAMAGEERLDPRAWRKSLVDVKERKAREREQLQIWLRLQEPLSEAFLPESRRPAELQRILLRASTLLQKLEDQGVALSPSEHAFLLELRELADIRPEQYLKEVRGTTKGHVQNLFQFGGYLAIVTKAEEDLAPILAKWQELMEAVPRDETRIFQCVLHFIDALLAFDRYEEAIAHARALTDTHRDAPYVWMHIALAKRDPELLAYARGLGEKRPPEEREWFFLRLYEQGGMLEDVQRCGGSTEEPRSFERSALFTAQLIHAHLKWDHIAEARALLKNFTHTERYGQALAALCLKTRDARDLDTLASHVHAYPPTKHTSLVPIVQALAENGRSDCCFELFDETTSWDMRCATYGIVSRYLPLRADELLERATALLLANCVQQSIEHVRTLYILVHSEAKRRRSTEAVRLANLIHDKRGRSRAFLLLYALSAGIPLPSFLED